MAVNSTSTSTNTFSGAIDVAGIVSSLMETRRGPVNRIDAEIQKRSVSISALGTFKSKVSVLQRALDRLERTTNWTDLTGADALARTAIESFVTAYNDLLTYYKTEGQRVGGATTQGALVGNSSVSQFMSQLRTLYSSGIHLADGSPSSFTLFGVDLESDGSLSVNEGNLAKALTTDQLATKLANGVQFGYQSDTQNLGAFLKNAVAVGGYFFSEIESQNNQVRTLESRKADIEASLSRVQERLTRQYAALDSQLLQLQRVSNSLTSMFSNLTGTNVRNR